MSMPSGTHSKGYLEAASYTLERQDLSCSGLQAAEHILQLQIHDGLATPTALQSD